LIELVILLAIKLVILLVFLQLIQQVALAQDVDDLLHFEIEGIGSVKDQVGEIDEWADEGEAAGADGGFVLLADGLGGAAALLRVALEAALVAEVVGGIDEDAELVERAELGEIQAEETFDDDHAAGVDGFGLAGDADVFGKAVERALDGFAAGEGFEVLGEQG
jgi:hypothetical protein